MNASSDWNITREMVKEKTDDHWTSCPPPLKDESFLSWFTRLAKDNCSDVRLLYQSLKKLTSLKGNSLSTISNQLSHLEIHSEIRNNQIEALKPLITISIDQIESLSHITEAPQDTWDYLNTPLETPRYCPHCLEQDAIPYFRAQWFAKPTVICPHHKVFLLNQCPACGQPIKFWDTEWNEGLIYCHHCHHNLSEGEQGAFYVKDITMAFDFQQVYDQGTFHSISTDPIYFFRQLWKLIDFETLDSLIKEANAQNELIPSERLYRALLLGYNCLQKDLNRLYKPFFCKLDHQTFEDYKQLMNHMKGHETEIIRINDHKKQRLKYLAPLIEIESPTYAQIKEVASHIGYSCRTVYRWWKSYQENENDGLKPKETKRGRTKRQFPLVYQEEFSNLISDYVNTGEKKGLARLYQDVKNIAQKAGCLDEIISPATMRNRVLEERAKLLPK